MQKLNRDECKIVSGASGNETCSAATIDMLAICSAIQRKQINQILKTIVLNGEISGTEPEVMRVEMITAIVNSDIDAIDKL